MDLSMKIDREFQNHLVPLSTIELGFLEDSILTEGCREKLIVWKEEQILVDGHNRFEICDRNDVDYEIEEKSFSDRDCVKDWIDRNQLGKRNLSPDDFKIVSGRIYNRRKKTEGRPGKTSATCTSKSGPTADAIANELGTSPDTIKRNGQRAAVHDAILSTGDIEGAEAAKTLPQKDVVEVKDKPIEQAARELKSKKQAHVSQNSGETEWYTPPEYIALVRLVVKQIDIDPASSITAQSVVKAKKYFTSESDGLKRRWPGRVFLNPPYSKELLPKFIDRLIGQFQSGETDQAILLVNNATDTAWFQSLKGSASAFCFVRGRIKFHDSTGTPAKTPLQGQVFCYFGKSTSSFVQTFSSIGFCMEAVS